MNSKNYVATPLRTKRILDKYQFTFKKSLGQNFLVDVNILKNIIKHAGIDNSSGIIEVGPGIGSLTEQLAIHAEKVVAYEIDQRLVPILVDTLHEYPNVQIINEDILNADLIKTIQTHFNPQQTIHIIANLPYYITTPIITKLLADRLPITSMTFMMQKEVAERMAAKPNSKSYGSLSIAVQYYTFATVVMSVPKGAFMPQPNVDSSVLQLVLRKDRPVDVLNENYFFSIIRACFLHRRKTLNNNLVRYFGNKYKKDTITKILSTIEVDGSRRAESLHMKEFARLANAFYQEEQSEM